MVHASSRPSCAVSISALALTGCSLVVALGLVATSAAAQSRDPQPPAALTWMVLNEINSTYFDRSEPMNRPALVTVVPEGMIRAVNVSNDGKPDWLIDYSSQGVFWCGTGGCLQTLYVSDGDDYVMAFDAQALELDIAQHQGEPIMEVLVHRVLCAEDEDECRYAFAWGATQQQLSERANSLGQTRLTGDFDPLGNDVDQRVPDALPDALNSMWFASRLTCPAYTDDGFEVRRATFRSIPDVTGDGRRDWLVTDPYRCQDANDETVLPLPILTVYASHETDFREAYRSEGGTRMEVDIAQTPARLFEMSDCPTGGSCPGVALRWNEGAGQFHRGD